MTGEVEAAGDVLTGAIVAGAVEGASGKQGPAAHGGKCPNCGATVDGAFCASCGQRAHLHRSLLHLGHDILHGVFHFEGKMWRTLPELFFHPGRLTRRYVDGERAKFVSPIALYLFTVFLMFGVFSFTASDMFSSAEDSVAGDVIEQWKENNEAAQERTADKADAVRDQLKEKDLSAAKRAELEKKLSDLQSAQVVMDALAKGDWAALQKLGTNEQARKAIEEAQAAAKAHAARERPKEKDLSADKRAELEKKMSDLQVEQAVMDALAKGDWAALQNIETNEKAKEAKADSEKKAGKTASSGITVNGGKVDFGWPALQARFEHGLKELKDNQALALYKMKIASYKYSWALIPLSVPLMWLLFFWRRDIHLYDHAIFVTYSITFMMMFLTLLTILAAFGVSNAIWGTALGIVPPLHLYKQLRYAYNLSRFGAWLRLFLLSIGVFIVLMIFFMLLLLIGMIG